MKSAIIQADNTEEFCQHLDKVLENPPDGHYVHDVQTHFFNNMPNSDTYLFNAVVLFGEIPTT